MLSVALRLALEAGAIVAILRWSRARDWTPGHYLAIAAGTTITYALFGLQAFMQGHTNLGVPTNRVDVAGQIVEAAVVIALIAWGALSRHAS